MLDIDRSCSPGIFAETRFVPKIALKKPGWSLYWRPGPKFQYKPCIRKIWSVIARSSSDYGLRQ